MPDWAVETAREVERYEDGAARLPGIADADERQRQLTRMGNAAGGAGLASLMAGDREGAGRWLAAAAERYRESFADAPPGSWGRPIGAVKARLIAGDDEGARGDADWALAAGAAASESPVGAYAATLALLVLGRDGEAAGTAARLQDREDFPRDVGAALAALASGRAEAYAAAVGSVLRSFETREAYLEDIAVADTAIVLQRLAAARGLAADLPRSALLPES